ncbi:MAG: hypothetical protein F6J93_29335 [Oscillatoria sp. SIO1A7]|nr:hypothetical protein [Oscillatoria sp. SIO1A7]
MECWDKFASCLGCPTPGKEEVQEQGGKGGKGKISSKYSVSQISVISDRVGKCRGDSIPALDLGCKTGIIILGYCIPQTTHIKSENRYIALRKVRA